jgi:hypothetical protein
LAKVTMNLNTFWGPNAFGSWNDLDLPCSVDGSDVP